jgi:O-Antigen ligase
MLTLRIKLLNGLDRLLALSLALLLLGSALAFGGGVWWARPVFSGLTFALVLAWLGRSALAGPWRVLKSPLTALGLMAVLLGVVQLLPLPVALVDRVSPRSITVVSIGMIPEKGLADDPSAVFPPPFLARSPLSVDRPSTLRWIVGAFACLGLFMVSSHYSDRFGKTQVIWGSVVAAFFVNAVLGGVQVSSHSSGLYGIFTPGSAPAWAPSLDDAMASPSVTVLRPIGEANPAGVALAAARPDKPFLIGSLMGGPGAFLALASLALPLAFGLTLQMMSPRGLRQGLFARLRDSGQGSLVLLMLGLIVAGAVLVGVIGGRIPASAFAIGLALVGLPGTWSSGLRKTGLALTVLVLASLASGVALGESSLMEASSPGGLSKLDWDGAKATWAESLPILRDFPVLGTGLGTFPAVHPYYKARDGARNNAMSSLLQWGVETGAVGLGLLATAGLWCLLKLPGAIRRVGTADRALAFGLVGSLACFGLFSAIHWTVELSAIALAASAVAGTANRWLAGGTDLFVDRG